jgi:DNA-binding winged helix-turn-helix (wHTH) protein/tetratricopeptide (TPR) repeat protein
MRYRFRGFVLDTARSELTRGGERVEAERRVYALLSLLLERRGEAVGKDEIFDRLWPDTATSDSSLTRLVSLTRAALGDRDRRQPIIRTLYGRGYQIAVPVEAEIPANRGDFGAAPSPFVGREGVLDELQHAMGRARSGELVLRFLVGEPGIGKSRAAYEFAARVASAGGRCLIGRSLADPSPVYSLWQPVVEQLRSDPKGESLLEGLVGDLAPLGATSPNPPSTSRPEAIDPEEARVRLEDAMAALLQRAADAPPVLLLLDDLQFADPSSLKLLGHVAGELTRAPVMILGTYRAPELEADPEKLKLLQALTSREPGCTIELTGLSRDDALEIARARLGGEPESGMIEPLQRLSGGNPFYLEELLFLVARADQDGAKLPSPLERGVPGNAIRHRLGGLSAECRELLAWGAVAGVEFDVAIVARAMGTTAQAVLGSVDEALRSQLIEAAGPLGLYRYRHGLVQDVLYRDLPEPERAERHAALGRVLESLRPEALEQIASHAYRGAVAGDAETALEYALQAAEACWQRLAFEASARHFDNGLELLDLLELDVPRRIDILLRIARTFAFFSPERAAELFSRAVAHARVAPDGAILARVALQGFDDLLWLRSGGDIDALLQRALEAPENADGPIRVRLLAALASRRRASLPSEAQRLSREAMSLARRIEDPEAMAVAFRARHACEESPGAAAERLDLAEQLRELGRSAPGAATHAVFAEGTRLAFVALSELGRLREAEDAAEQLGSHAVERGGAVDRVHWRAARALLAMMRGDHRGAERWSNEALQECSRVPTAAHVARQNQAAVRTQAEFLRAEFEGPAWQRLRDSVGGSDAPVLLLPLAMNEAKRGNLSEAKRLFEFAARNDFAEAAGILLIAHPATEACFDVGAPRHAELLFPLLQPWAGLLLVTATPIGCYGCGDSRLGCLATVAGEWERAAYHFERALELTRRVGAVMPRLEAATYYAESLARRGRLQDAALARVLADGVRTEAGALGLALFARQAESALRKLSA